MPHFKNKIELGEKEKLDWLKLIRTENVGPITFYKLIDNFGSAKKALEEIPNIAKRGGKLSKVKIPSDKEVLDEYKRLKKLGGEIVCACEPQYSEALLACDDCPPVLMCLGDTSLLNKKNIAVIGNRNPTIVSKNMARRISMDLGEKGFVIASGLASGIDTCAHEGGLANGTIAVLGGGVDVIYPKENLNIYNEIKTKGLIISEVPMGTQPIARHFPKRNRIVAGLSRATVVIEAKLQSGSLITAKQALDYGRDVMAVPGHPMEPKAKGTNSLIQRQGANLVTSANDIIEAMDKMIKPLFKEEDLLSFDFEPIQTKEVNIEDLDETKDILLNEYINYVPIEINSIISDSKMPVNLILTALLDLELAGRIETHSGNKVSLLS
ncbi:MAG: DNA-processing protein DprA [Alphaproteobacteria bacterium]|jgi:DNA processing protein|nr:DNA-processing protein DprA [Alphaproteobacteria bacterium]